MKVDVTNYKLFEYQAFFDCDKPIDEKPENSQYDLGDVVYIIPTNSIGVVLGCIDNVREDLRTDMDGMKCFSEIRPATMDDFKIEGVTYTDQLLGELTRQQLQK